MSVLIKNFGNDTECFNAHELKNTLKEKYPGKSVSITYLKSSSVKSIALVDVQEDGSLLDTYNQTTVCLSEFRF